MDPPPTVTLMVRVADAQGLRLFRGGELRLVISLRADDDPDGILFGAKVTPWQQVPENQAPIWRAREAIWAIPAERCFQAEFVDSAYLCLVMKQRGHSKPSEKTPAPLAAEGLSWSSFAAVLKGASETLSGAVTDDSEIIGTLRLPLGKRLVCSGDPGGMEGAQWAQIYDEEDTRRIKGSLLLEFVTVHNLAQPPKPAVSVPTPPPSQECQDSSPVDIDAAESSSPPPQAPPPVAAPPVGVPPATPVPVEEPLPQECVAPSPESLVNTEATSDSTGDASDSESGASDVAASHASHASQGSTSTSRDDLAEKRVVSISDDHLRLVGDSNPRPTKWTPTPKKVMNLPESCDPESEVNIFTINQSKASAAAAHGATYPLKLLSKFSAKPRTRPLTERLRTMLDPAARQQRREVQKWRHWHDLFCALNDIERRLVDVRGLLGQASSSMRTFGESHGQLTDVHIGAFLGDAVLYFRSEAEVPRQLDDHLGALERIGDGFRSISMDAPCDETSTDFSDGEPRESEELRTSCEDLQMDIAVLLESAMMTAQQALAMYKKMHCRLELLATEYESVCRLDLDAPLFLPLIVEGTAQAAVTAAIPERAVEWAVDFCQLVGTSSHSLELLVRELGQRTRQLKSLSGTLRSLTLQRAASGQTES